MRFAALLAIALLMGGCASAPQTPLIKTTLRTEFAVKVHIVEPPNDVHVTCQRLGSGLVTRRGAACSQFDPKRNLLTIWVREPAALEDYMGFARIGHEVWHAVREDFHKDWE